MIEPLEIEADGVPCPRCGGACERTEGGLWACEECGGVWSTPQIADGPIEATEETTA